MSTSMHQLVVIYGNMRIGPFRQDDKLQRVYRRPRVPDGVCDGRCRHDECEGGGTKYPSRGEHLLLDSDRHLRNPLRFCAKFRKARICWLFCLLTIPVYRGILASGS